MCIILYMLRAVTLLRYASSAEYRARTRARWKMTPTHLIIYEIGGGAMGLILLGALLWLIWVKLG